MSAPAELVSFLAKRIVDDPEAVRVEELEQGADLVLRLHVAEGDRGKVIGRRGRMVQALRVRGRRPRRPPRPARDRRVVLLHHLKGH
jgi:predicted RNA-binding protein YlqC (UPF0109 family)